jgi:pimeloyl-ACP methyl ester carboxylesterase
MGARYRQVALCGKRSFVPMSHTTFFEGLRGQERAAGDASMCAEIDSKSLEFLKKKAKVEIVTVPLAMGLGKALLLEPHVPSQPASLIIFMHALGEDYLGPYLHWFDELLDAGASVLSIQWDGHGAEGASHLDFQAATRTLPLVLQKVLGEPGKGLLPALAGRHSVFLAGHSFGASLALIAASRPDVARLVSGVLAVSPVVASRRLSFRQSERSAFRELRAWTQDFLPRLPLYGISSFLPFWKGKRVAPQRILPRGRTIASFSQRDLLGEACAA